MRRQLRSKIVICGLVFALSACHAPASRESAAFYQVKLDEMDAAITQAITDGKTPGAVLWVERNGVRYIKSYGRSAVVPAQEPAASDTIYDLASLTKVVATTPAIMLLVERGRLDLDSTVKEHIPEFAGGGKESITIRHLLTHTSGLRPGLSASPEWSGHEKAIELACAEKTQNPPGSVFRYSDINFILLGEVVQRATNRRLDEFVAREIYRPLKMNDTGFLPPDSKIDRIAPTQERDGQMLRGIVHDPTSRRMGGVAGHAGVFSTAADLARYARMLLNSGTLDGARIFSPQTIKLMTSVHTPPSMDARRGLGWDIDSGYSRPRGKYFPLGSFGHTGWTGTCIWIDPFSKTFWVLLSNRVHPDGKGNVLPLQGKLGTLVAEAVVGFNFIYVPGSLPPRESDAQSPAADSKQPQPETATVLNGIDVLARQDFAPLKGLRVALITNQTGTDRRRNSTIDLLRNAPGVQLKALFSPEHGIRGDRDESIADSVDEKTGLPVYSLYGKYRAPTPEQLNDIDALAFDVQDIGCRFYTYIATLGNCLEAAGQAGLKFFVLDRVNPITGLGIDGPVYAGESSFTAYHNMPVQHGMTVGELARMFNKERNFKADLTVVPVEGWKREFWFDQTGLPWINTSPNMRSLAEAILYPGIGLLETTALSVGRGTGTPFEVIGAPYIDDARLAAELNRAGLEGIRFVPVKFTPTASVFKGQSCSGVSILITDRDRCQPINAGLTIAQTLHRLYPDKFNLDKFNVLLAHKPTIDAIRAGKGLNEIRSAWASALADFERRRAEFLLYR